METFSREKSRDVKVGDGEGCGLTRFRVRGMRQSSQCRSNLSGETAKPVTQASISRGGEQRPAVGVTLEAEGQHGSGLPQAWFRFGNERGLRVGSGV